MATAPVYLKLRRDGSQDVHRLPLHRGATLELVKQTVSELFGLQDGQYTLKYQDDEGDWVTVQSDEELALAKDIMTDIGKASLQLLVTAKQATISQAASTPATPSTDKQLPSEQPAASEALPAATPADSEAEAESSASQEGPSPQDHPLPTFQAFLAENLGFTVDEHLSEELDRLAVEGSAFMEKIFDVVENIQAQVVGDSSSSREEGDSAAPSPPRCQRSRTIELHRGVICDGCGASPIFGARYKCKNCEDFDYCGACYARREETHAPEHEFLVIDASACGRRGRGWGPRGGRGRRCRGRCVNIDVTDDDEELLQGIIEESMQAAAPSPAQTETETEASSSTATEPDYVHVASTESPSEPPSSPAPVPGSNKWAEKLQVLRDMGFTDDATNIALLERCYGHIPAVLNQLLQ